MLRVNMMLNGMLRLSSTSLCASSRLLKRCKWINISMKHSTSTRRYLSSRSSIKEDLKYCVDLVQKRDYDAYLCGLLIPGDKAKISYFATRAFNVEIGTALQDTNTNDNMFGAQLRLQFWRDAIEKVYDDKDVSLYESPVLRALRHVRLSTNISKILLERLIDAREMDLDFVANASEKGDKIIYLSIADMEKIGELTSSSLLYIAFEGANVNDCLQADIAASHLGQSLGLVNIMKGTVVRAARGEICIPGDLCEKHDVSAIDIIQHPLFQEKSETDSNKTTRSSNQLRAATKDLVNATRTHLSHVRNIQGDLPKEARPCLLQAVSALHYLDCLEKVDYDLFDAQMLNKQSSRNDLFHHLKLGRAWLTGVF